MKKLIYSLFTLIVFITNAQSQNDTVWINGVPRISKHRAVGMSADEPSSPLKKDDYLLEVSYGYPFIPYQEGNVFGSAFTQSSKLRKITKNTNHLCLRTDYQLNQEFSVGLEFTYASIVFDYTRIYSSFTGNSVVTKDSVFSASAQKIRFLAKMGYHFNISDRFDAFGTAGFGFKQFTYTTADASAQSNNLVNEVIPVAIRLSLGGRFFLSDNIAIHFEGGVGGPIMQIGISYKMN